MQLIPKVLFIPLLLISSSAMAQFENRINLYAGLGVVPFQPDAQVQTETIFQGYRSVPFFHGYLGYSVNRKLALGGTFRQLITSKDNYVLSNSMIGFGIKYNFIPFDKSISPFVYADLGVNYTYLSQQQNTKTIKVEPTDNPSDVTVDEITLQEPELQLNIFPSFSAMIGAGAEFTIKRIRKKNLGLFLFGGYSLSNTASKNNVTELFTRNNSEFNYFLICGGLRFSFLQRKSLY